MNMEIAEEVRLDGVNLDQEDSFLVWDNVYDELMRMESLCERIRGLKYDCTVFIGMDELEWKKISLNLFPKIQVCSRYVLTDHNYEQWENKGYKVNELKVEKDIYYFFDFGE